jgi:hypothetical protein
MGCAVESELTYTEASIVQAVHVVVYLFIKISFIYDYIRYTNMDRRQMEKS